MKNRNGQSLLEVIVALAVVLLVVLALVRAVVTAVRSSDFAKKSAQASSFAQEGMESMRAFRDASWTVFWAAATGVNRDLSGSTPGGSCLTTPNLANTFIRCVKMEQITDPDPNKNKVKTAVTVSWTDSNGTHKSEQISYFTKWQ